MRRFSLFIAEPEAFKRLVLYLLASFSVLVAGCTGSPTQTGPEVGFITGYSLDQPPPQVGQPAPDFQFRFPDGQESSLSKLRGRVVLINFWTTECPNCVEEMPYLQQIYEEWSGRVVVLAINLGEGEGVVKRFLQEHGFSLSVLLDSRGGTGEVYRVVALPISYLIDRNGIIQGRKVGAFADKEEIEEAIRRLFPS